MSRAAEKNLESIKGIGFENWLQEQKKRRLLLENLLDNYNEGRSMSFYCLAALLMPSVLINGAVNELKERLAAGQIYGSDVKAQAKVLRAIIQSRAQDTGIELKS